MPRKQRERRRRGDGSVTVARRDASGKPILWKACISLGVVTINGKARRHRPTEYAETEAEAYVLLKQLQAQHLTGDDMTPNIQTVEAFLIRWLAHVRTVKSLGTYEVYESRCRVHIIPAIGGLKLRTLKTAHIQTMLDVLARKGLAPNTISGIRSTIIKALNMARKWGDLKRGAPNPAADTEIEPVIEQKPATLDEAQLDRLLATAAGDVLEPLIIVALGTGYRIGECLGLLWANVDEDHEEIRLTGALKRRKAAHPRPGARYDLIRESYTKTHDQRTTYLASRVAEALDLQRHRQQELRDTAGAAWEARDLVFTDAYGRPLEPTRTSQRFKQLAKRAGLPPEIHFHSLRHSCATFLIKQGVHQRTMMEILGHRSLRTAERYGRVLPEVTRDALGKHGQRLARREVNNET